MKIPVYAGKLKSLIILFLPISPHRIMVKIFGSFKEIECHNKYIKSFILGNFMGYSILLALFMYYS